MNSSVLNNSVAKVQNYEWKGYQDPKNWECPLNSSVVWGSYVCLSHPIKSLILFSWTLLPRVISLDNLISF